MKTVELFSGAGGTSLGFKSAGLEITQALDAWPNAVSVYRKNVGPAELADLKDIADVAPKLFAMRPDLVAGGPPCQDYSSAGGRQEGERAALTIAYAMIISIVRPQWLVMENVPAVINSASWKDAEAILRNAGYGFTIQKLDAAYYGIGQSRERLIVVARLGEAEGFLREALLSAATPKPMTARDVLGDTVGDTFYVHPRHMYKRRLWSAYEPAPTVRSTYARRIPPDYIPIASDAKGHSAPTQLTRDQVSALQGFPANFDWSGISLEDRDRMVANAVPIPFATALGKVIIRRHRGETQPSIHKNFSAWLRCRGNAPSTIDDIRTKINKARRLLGGRMIADTAVEIATLEGVGEFMRLPTKTQSALRVSLRLHAEFRQTLSY